MCGVQGGGEVGCCGAGVPELGAGVIGLGVLVAGDRIVGRGAWVGGGQVAAELGQGLG